MMEERDTLGERAPRHTSTSWSARVRESLQRARRVDMPAVLALVESKIEESAEGGVNKVLVTREMLPQLLTLDALCEALHAKHGDMVFRWEEGVSGFQFLSWE
jgi:hypothetical protein